jgi:hypothetical protein
MGKRLGNQRRDVRIVLERVSEGWDWEVQHIKSGMAQHSGRQGSKIDALTAAKAEIGWAICTVVVKGERRGAS